MGIEYENAGVMLVQLTEKIVLAIGTPLESLPDVMEATRAALPMMRDRGRET